MARGGCLRCGRWRLNLGILAVESGQNTPVRHYLNVTAAR